MLCPALYEQDWLGRRTASTLKVLQDLHEGLLMRPFSFFLPNDLNDFKVLRVLKDFKDFKDFT